MTPESAMASVERAGVPEAFRPWHEDRCLVSDGTMQGVHHATSRSRLVWVHGDVRQASAALGAVLAARIAVSWQGLWIPNLDLRLYAADEAKVLALTPILVVEGLGQIDPGRIVVGVLMGRIQTRRPLWISSAHHPSRMIGTWEAHIPYLLRTAAIVETTP